MPLSDQVTASGQSAENLVEYIDDQQSRLQKRQAGDLARLATIPEGPARQLLTDNITERGAQMDQNEAFKSRLNNGEHPASVQWNMVEQNAYLMQNTDKELVQKQAAELPPSNAPEPAGVYQAQFGQLAELAKMNPAQIRERIDNAEVRVDGTREMAGYLANDGDHLMAGVLLAEANESANLAPVLESFEQAKLSGQAVDAQKLAGALESLDSASKGNQQAKVDADQQKRQLFQSEIADKIGPQLDEMGLSANEKAVVVKTLADYSLDHDDLKPNVTNAEGVAQVALENLQSGNFHQEGINDPSEQRIQDATRRALGMEQVMGNDGQVTVDRPDAKNLSEGKFQETLQNAKNTVAQQGPDAIIGQESIEAGQQLKASLNAKSAELAVQQNQNVPAPSVGQDDDGTAHSAAKRPSVRDMLRGAATTIKNTIGEKIDQMKLDRLEKQLEKRENHLNDLTDRKQFADQMASSTPEQKQAEREKLQKAYDPGKMLDGNRQERAEQMKIAEKIEMTKMGGGELAAKTDKLQRHIDRNEEKVGGLKEKVKAQEAKMELRAGRNDNSQQQRQNAPAARVS